MYAESTLRMHEVHSSDEGIDELKKRNGRFDWRKASALGTIAEVTFCVAVSRLAGALLLDAGAADVAEPDAEPEPEAEPEVDDDIWVRQY